MATQLKSESLSHPDEVLVMNRRFLQLIGCGSCERSQEERSEKRARNKIISCGALIHNLF